MTMERSPVQFQTAVPGDRTLDTLSDDENAALCSDLQAAEHAFERDPAIIAAACRFRTDSTQPRGIDPDTARALCRQTYDACVAELSTKPLEPVKCPNQSRACSDT